MLILGKTHSVVEQIRSDMDEIRSNAYKISDENDEILLILIEIRNKIRATCSSVDKFLDDIYETCDEIEKYHDQLKGICYMIYAFRGEADKNRKELNEIRTNCM